MSSCCESAKCELCHGIEPVFHQGAGCLKCKSLTFAMPSLKQLYVFQQCLLVSSGHCSGVPCLLAGNGPSPALGFAGACCRVWAHQQICGSTGAVPTTVENWGHWKSCAELLGLIQSFLRSMGAIPWVCLAMLSWSNMGPSWKPFHLHGASNRTSCFSSVVTTF